LRAAFTRHTLRRESRMRNHLYPLDLLRFVSALLVLTYHYGFFSWARRWGSSVTMLDHTARFDPAAPFTWFGWIGVQVFFVISGFVIANSAYGRSAVDFLKGRLVRLYPAAWICATITLCAWLALAHLPFSAVRSGYLHSMALWIFAPWIDGVYWSLAIEVMFYALIFFVLASGRIVKLTWVPWILTALSMFYLWVVYTPDVSTFFAGNGPLNWIMQNSGVFLLRQGCFFALGIWLWLMSRNEMTPPRYAGLWAATASCIGVIIYKTEALENSPLTIHLQMPLWIPIVIWLLAMALIVTVARAPHWFEVRSPKWQAALKRIGLMTYPMFLVHNVLGAGIVRTAVAHGLNQWIALALATIVALALAYLICATAEVMLRKRLRATLDYVERLIRQAIAPKKAPC
jgi:peptidoglycan/LPS O-acetylase OafA/YrhL